MQKKMKDNDFNKCARCGYVHKKSTDMAIYTFVQPNGGLYRGCVKCISKLGSTKLTEAQKQEIIEQMRVGGSNDTIRN